MTTLPSTASTIKANSILTRRREQRRRDLQSEVKSKPLKVIDVLEKEQRPPSPPTTNPDLKNTEPQFCNPQSAATPDTPKREEKVYSHLAQRRAKRRQRNLVLSPEKSEKSRIVEILGKYNMSKQKRLIVLVSNGVSDRSQASNQARALMLLKAKETPFVEVDGMDPSQRERRNELFEISGIRANYPQFFLEDKDGTVTFFGNWDKIEEMNDSSMLDEETLKSYPQMVTWDSVFGSLVESFD